MALALSVNIAPFQNIGPFQSLNFDQNKKRNYLDAIEIDMIESVIWQALIGSSLIGMSGIIPLFFAKKYDFNVNMGIYSFDYYFFYF